MCRYSLGVLVWVGICVSVCFGVCGEAGTALHHENVLGIAYDLRIGEV